jgi:hypothetical protein
VVSQGCCTLDGAPIGYARAGEARGVLERLARETGRNVVEERERYAATAGGRADASRAAGCGAGRGGRDPDGVLS